jgi:hypothetical protein
MVRLEDMKPAPGAAPGARWRKSCAGGGGSSGGGGGGGGREVGGYGGGKPYIGVVERTNRAGGRRRESVH